MCIYRRIQKFAHTRIETNLPLPNTAMCIAENGTLSSATESCNTPPQTKVKRVRMTAHGSQTVRQAQNEKPSNYKIAFKHATTVYSREKEKKGGMSAQDVSDLIKNQIKESISAQMIQRNVKNGQVGSSPIRCLQESSDGIRKFRCDQPTQWDGMGDSSQEACVARASSPPYPHPSRKRSTGFSQACTSRFRRELQRSKG